MASIRFANCMELPIGRMASRLAVYPFFPSVLIPYNAIGIDSILAKARFHTATSCGLHTFLRNDLERRGEERWQNAIYF